MERQSPWSKLWLLEAASSLRTPRGQKDESAVTKWVHAQLKDPHETVRAEAAWYLSGRDEITEEKLSKLYIRATSITRPGLAAALGRVGTASGSPIAKAVRADSPLTARSFDWGQGQAA